MIKVQKFRESAIKITRAKVEMQVILRNTKFLISNHSVHKIYVSLNFNIHDLGKYIIKCATKYVTTVNILSYKNRSIVPFLKSYQ